MSEGEVRHGRSIPEKRGYLLIWVLWDSHTEAIIDVIFVNANVEIYKK